MFVLSGDHPMNTSAVVRLSCVYSDFYVDRGPTCSANIILLFFSLSVLLLCLEQSSRTHNSRYSSWLGYVFIGIMVCLKSFRIILSRYSINQFNSSALPEHMFNNCFSSFHRFFHITYVGTFNRGLRLTAGRISFEAVLAYFSIVMFTYHNLFNEYSLYNIISEYCDLPTKLRHDSIL